MKAFARWVVAAGLIMTALAGGEAFAASPAADNGRDSAIAAPLAPAADRQGMRLAVTIPSEEDCYEWVFKNVCVPVAKVILKEVCDYIMKEQPASPPPPPAPGQATPPPAKPIIIKVKVCKKVPETVTEQKCTQQRVCAKHKKK